MLGPKRLRLDWRDLDRAALDKAYNNSAAVARSAAIVERWGQESAAIRAAHNGSLDLAYGSRPRQRLDFLKAAEGAPTLVFLHGGYWQMRSKDIFAFAAKGPLAAGINVAVVGYTLAPDVTLDAMVAEVRDALDWLVVHVAELGGNPDRIFLGGWSAGAHLAAMALDHPCVRGGLGISGLYDLEPIQHCYVNDKLGLDEASARRNSPIWHLPASSPPWVIVVGEAELPLMIQQSEEYAAARTERGLPTTFAEIPDADHFTILDHLSEKTGVISRLLHTLVAD